MFIDSAPHCDQDDGFSSQPDSESRLNSSIELARTKLLLSQSEKGFWVFELEADCTISAEYILMMHFMDEIDLELQAKIAHYLRQHQSEDGSYPLYEGGAGDISCTIKVYYALKLAGDLATDPHLQKAAKWILANGGAARANVFTRILLAMFEQLPWRGVPFMPVEIMLLPKWFPFHLHKISYWSRTVMVPLLILYSFRVVARNPQKIGVAELFVTPAEQERHYFSQVKTPLGRLILLLDRIGLALEPMIPGFIRRKATARAQDWFMARLNGEDGLGGIFTAMVNAYEAMDYLGIPADNPQRLVAKQAIKRLLVIQDEYAYCQPCVSPVWDTGLVSLALQETLQQSPDLLTEQAVNSALNWLVSKQLHDEPGDWRVQRPDLTGGGWAFQFNNSYYPDLDDTAVVGLALLQANTPALAGNVDRAASWIAGMQSKNAGFAAFDADNNYAYLNQIPFADHGALLDPPTADVSGRCVMFLSKCIARQPELKPHIKQCITYLRQQQESDGSWYGRWGTNYIYGTWSVLLGFENAGIPRDDPSIQQAVSWLKSKQRSDGGWGEGNYSYHNPAVRGEFDTSTAFQTALALLGLLSAGEYACPQVRLGVQYLLKTQQLDGFWKNDCFNAPGFPKFFYLKYHGYHKFFPLWALARYRNEQFIANVR